MSDLKTTDTPAIATMLCDLLTMHLDAEADGGLPGISSERYPAYADDELVIDETYSDHMIVSVKSGKRFRVSVEEI